MIHRREHDSLSHDEGSQLADLAGLLNLLDVESKALKWEARGENKLKCTMMAKLGLKEWQLSRVSFVWTRSLNG